MSTDTRNPVIAYGILVQDFRRRHMVDTMYPSGDQGRYQSGWNEEVKDEYGGESCACKDYIGMYRL